MKSKQGGVTCAFLHADLAPDESVYVDVPLGFNTKTKNGKRQVLKLNKTLYGLCQSPRAFWKYITEKLESCGLKQSRVAMELCKLGVTLELEDDAAGFLGVKMEHDSNTGLLEMKQTGLIERDVEALGLDDGYAWGKHTPAETKPINGW